MVEGGEEYVVAALFGGVDNQSAETGAMLGGREGPDRGWSGSGAMEGEAEEVWKDGIGGERRKDNTGEMKGGKDCGEMSLED